MTNGDILLLGALAALLIIATRPLPPPPDTSKAGKPAPMPMQSAMRWMVRG